MSDNLGHEYVFIATGILADVCWKVLAAPTASPLHLKTVFFIPGQAISATFRCTTGHGTHACARATGYRSSAAIPEQSRQLSGIPLVSHSEGVGVGVKIF